VAGGGSGVDHAKGRENCYENYRREDQTFGRSREARARGEGGRKRNNAIGQIPGGKSPQMPEKPTKTKLKTKRDGEIENA